MHVDNCVAHRRPLNTEFKEFRNLIHHECLTLYGSAQHDENELCACNHCSIFFTPYMFKYTRNKRTLFFLHFPPILVSLLKNTDINLNLLYSKNKKTILSFFRPYYHQN